MLKRQTCDRRGVGSFSLLHSTGGFIATVTVGIGVKISCAGDVLSMDCGRMSNEAEYMNLDVENKSSKKCQHTQEDVSLQHVPEIRLGNFFRSLPTQSAIWSLLHNPATCPLSVYLTRFCPRYILEQHIRATCPLVWTHLKEDNQGYNSV